MPDAAPFTAMARAYDAIMLDVEYEEWAAFLLDVLRQLGWKAAGRAPRRVRVLDLGCGTGNSSLPFAREGFSVTGVDASEEMLAVARAKLSHARFHRQRFETLDLEGRFDLIVSLFDSLNNLTDPADLAETLARSCRHLAPGGWLAFDVNTPAGVADLWDDGRFSGTAGDGVAFDWRHSFDPATGLGKVEANFTVDGVPYRETHFERGYGPRELTPLLLEAGFGEVHFLEYPHLAPPRPDAPRVWCFAAPS
ncbi:MAG TPA: methyltransferase domain-containing protein [Deinococcales bacterium]|nr:methyltransferase domain-containing protein [Deinococcales bacterium]